MNIKKTDREYIITVPANTDIEGVQRLLNFLLFREITADTQNLQEEADKLAAQVNKSWWEKNKDKYLGK